MNFKPSFQLIFVTLAVNLNIIAGKDDVGVRCELVWMQRFKDGGYPDDAIDFGSDEIIVRVSDGADYCGGR